MDLQFKRSRNGERVSLRLVGRQGWLTSIARTTLTFVLRAAVEAGAQLVSGGEMGMESNDQRKGLSHLSLSNTVFSSRSVG
jgi:hypothetical protein